MNKIERKLYNLITEEGEIVKNKKTGNVYMVKQLDPDKHTKPTPKEVEKTKAANGGKVPTADTPKPKPSTTSTSKEQPTKQEPKKIAAADFKTSAEKDKEQKSEPSKIKGAIPKDRLKSLMPGMDTTKKSVSEVPPEARQKAVTEIDKIAADLIKAKETGTKAPNTNLCKVSIPGTNLYCDDNKGIRRKNMPQFRGKPEPGSEADKMQRDKNGEVETSHLFDRMLEKEGIKISKPAPIPPDSLKATQKELVGPKVVGMMGGLDKRCDTQNCDEKSQQDYKNLTDPIYVSNDGYVVDGHHRWAAIVSYNVKNPDKQIPMNVRVIGAGINKIIPKANKFAQDIGIAAKSGKEGTKGGPPAAQTAPMTENKIIKLSSLLK